MSTTAHGQQFLPPGDHRHETSDVNARGLYFFLAILVTGIVIIAALLAGLFRLLDLRAKRADPAPSPLAEERSPPPAPRLQVSPNDDLRQLRAGEREILQKMRWVSRED